MKLRFVACALFCTVAACTQDPAGSDAGVDLAVSLDGGADLAVGDASGDLSSPDLLAAADMDNHQPLRLPPDAVPLKQDGGVDYYEMHVKPGTAQVLPGPATPIWGFDGQWPGPTIHATMGRPITLRIFNELPVNENITIHNHGHNVAAAYDGHPSDNTISPTGPNNFYDYHYPNMQMGGTDPDFQGAGTYFYHDHEAGLTAPHFYKGLSGFYLIHPKSSSMEAALNLPSGAYDIPLMVQDRSFKADNELDYNVSFINGFQGDVLTVNGTAHPYLEVARRKYRFRILNAANARRFDIGLSSGSMYEIATDGGLLPTIVSAPRIPLAPAERVDVVIDFSEFKIGDVVTMTNDDSFTPVLPEILQFRVVRDEADPSSLPVTLNTLYKPITTTASTTTRSLVFDYINGQWTMNGHTYDPTAFEFKGTHLGDTEIWSLTNNSPSQQIPHPFHQHLVQFQIIDICAVNNPACGTPPPATASGWKDTVLVPPGDTVRVRMTFYYNGSDIATAFASPAPYVFHCHNLEHEDHAMMLQQQINYP